MNDDDHRYGALRESYDFEYAVMEQADKNKNTHFDFETYDTYQWYLDLGPLSNINTKYLHGSIPYWNASVDHPDYDDFWKKEAWVNKLQPRRFPTSTLPASGTRKIPGVPGKSSATRKRTIRNTPISSSPGRGITANGGAQGRQHRARSLRRTRNRPRVPREHRGSILPLLPARQGREAGVAGQHISKRIEHLAHLHSVAAKECEAHQSLLACGREAFVHRAGGTWGNGKAYREYVSDPANPVPYRQRPISPTYPAGDWRTWEVADQRFVDHRPDVLSFVSDPLEHDLTVTGPLAANLFASTSGTDSDFIVKLIDVYPDNAQKNDWNPDEGPKPGQYAQSLNGYELPIAMEVRRGRYLASYEKPQALKPNQPTEWNDPAARPRPCFPQRAPHHGPDSVHVVSRDRPQSAEVRAQYL